MFDAVIIEYIIEILCRLGLCPCDQGFSFATNLKSKLFPHNFYLATCDTL